MERETDELWLECDSEPDIKTYEQQLPGGMSTSSTMGGRKEHKKYTMKQTLCFCAWEAHAMLKKMIEARAK